MRLYISYKGKQIRKPSPFTPFIARVLGIPTPSTLLMRSEIKRLLPLLLLALTSFAIHADEHILHFDSSITVYRNGSMKVTETIKVRAEGEAIKRGIYRDFPTDYRDANGNHYNVTFDIIKVLRDGRVEDYHVKRLDNGVRVYIGSAELFLMPGEYSYSISYRTNRQLGFFTDHDELYWNVTGNGWKLPIDHVSAEVHLPSGIELAHITTDAYTGATGEKGQAYLAEALSSGANFKTTEPLDVYQGLTVVVTWPKGFVHEPPLGQRLFWWISDNSGLAAGGGGLLLLFGFYLVAWVRVGRDPKPGVIIPQYEAPTGFSPGAVSFIAKEGHSYGGFTAALVSLATKGYLTLEQDGNEYTVQRTEKPTDESLGPGEQALLKALFKDMKTKVVPFNETHQKRIASAINAHERALQNHYYTTYFRNNSALLFPGILISIGTLVGSVALSQNHAFFGVSIMILLINIVFYNLLKAPTKAGRAMLDKLEGLKLYLEVAEKDELQFKYPPEKTPELFERLFPYAIALNVEQPWAERFTAIFAKLASEQRTYSPEWYRGDNFNSQNLGDFAIALGGSMSTVIASSSIAPGSDSGSSSFSSGSGGFSGGGGGGGGGGGW